MRNLTKTSADRARQESAEERSRHTNCARVERLEERALLAVFNFADFSDSSDLALIGDASITHPDDRLRLTPAAGGMEGAAWYTAERPFLSSGFSTTSRFKLADFFDSLGGTDGIVFANQKSNTTLVGGRGRRLSGPVELAFQGGDLFVASWSNHKVIRYDGTTGVNIDTVVDSGRLKTPLGLLFERSGSFLVSSRDSDESRQCGSANQAAAAVSLNNASAISLTVNFQTLNGTALTGEDNDSADGTITFAPGEIYKPILIQTTDDATLEGYESLKNHSDKESRHRHACRN